MPAVVVRGAGHHAHRRRRARRRGAAAGRRRRPLPLRRGAGPAVGRERGEVLLAPADRVRSPLLGELRRLVGRARGAADRENARRRLAGDDLPLLALPRRAPRRPARARTPRRRRPRVAAAREHRVDLLLVVVGLVVLGVVVEVRRQLHHREAERAHAETRRGRAESRRRRSPRTPRAASPLRQASGSPFVPGGPGISTAAPRTLPPRRSASARFASSQRVTRHLGPHPGGRRRGQELARRPAGSGWRPSAATRSPQRSS